MKNEDMDGSRLFKILILLQEVIDMAEDKKIIHEVDIRIHLSIDNAKLNGRDILDIPLKELLNMMSSTQKVCGNCIHFKPDVKCSENDVGRIGIGRCTLWLRNELDIVNRLNNKLPHNIDESACEHYFSKKTGGKNGED